MNENCVNILRFYLLYFPTNKPPNSITIGSGRFIFLNDSNGQRNPQSDFPDFNFLSYGYVSVRIMVRDWSIEKHCSTQFLNAIERVPVRLESSIQKHAGSRGAALMGGTRWQSPPVKKNFEEKKNLSTYIIVFRKISFKLSKEEKKIHLKIVWNICLKNIFI